MKIKPRTWLVAAVSIPLFASSTVAASAEVYSQDDGDYQPGDVILDLGNYYIEDGVDLSDPVIVVDDYGNETLAQVSGGVVIASAETQAVTEEGARALGRSSDPEGPVSRAGCGSWIRWSAAAFAPWGTSTSTCAVLGATPGARMYYEWLVDSESSGTACTKMKGFGNVNGNYETYWWTGSCSNSGGSFDTHWGMVLGHPAIQFRASVPPYGVVGDWIH